MLLVGAEIVLLPNALLPKAPELSADPEDAETLGNELVEAALDAKRPPLQLLDANMLLRGAVVASDLKMSPLEDVPAEKIDVEPPPEVVDETPVLDELLGTPNRLPVDAVANANAGAAEAKDPNKFPVEATLEPNNEPLELPENRPPPEDTLVPPWEPPAVSDDAPNGDVWPAPKKLGTVPDDAEVKGDVAEGQLLPKGLPATLEAAEGAKGLLPDMPSDEPKGDTVEEAPNREELVFVVAKGEVEVDENGDGTDEPVASAESFA
jgi:hypothetical protein